MTYISIAILVLLIPPVLYDLLFRPAIRRIGLRNVARRPGEAALVIVGSMLATALIVASFMVGDSFGTSFRVEAEDRLGPIDLLVPSEDVDADLAALEGSLDDGGGPIESLLAIREGAINAANLQGKIEPGVLVWELDPEEARGFGNDLDATGLAELPNSLASNELAINQELADELGVEAGETINLVAGPAVLEMNIVSVLPRRGVAGFAPIIVAKGALSGSFPDAEQVFRDTIVVSNVGGTYEGANTTAESEDYIRSVLREDTPINTAKAFILGRADAIASNTTSQFSTVGGFSVAAGVLLVVNLFVMLAAERKVDLGTMRAIGVQRSHTRRAFSIEGLIYGLVATILGLGVGYGVAAAILWFADGKFEVESDFQLRLGVEATSLFSGAVIGLAISQLTVLATTMRVVRINIVAALKDAVLPRSKGDSLRGIVLGLVAIVIAVIGWLLASSIQFVAFVTPILFAVGLIPLLTRLVGQKVAVVIGCGLGLFWASAAFGILSDTFEDTRIEIFLVQGIILVGLSVSILAAFDRWMIAAIRTVTRGSVSSRIGLSNPLARPVRTALLVSMYALVIFTVSFMAVLNTVLEQEGPENEALAGGSYDLFLFSSQLSPLETEKLTSRDDIEVAVEMQSGPAMVASHILARNSAEYFGEDTTQLPETDDEAIPERRFITLVTADFVSNGAPTLTDRSPDFDSDDAAWQQVAADPSVAIVPRFAGFEIGESMQLVGEDGSRSTVTVIGLSGWNVITGLGMYMSAEQSDKLLDEFQPTRRHHLIAADGVEPSALVDQLETDFAANGADANSFSASIEAEAAETEAFIQILQGFLGLGLLIGIAGLSVVLIRGVRERRQQLGMLRAVGFRSTILRNSFLVEACFIGSQGVILGVGLGLLSSWQVLTKSTAFADDLEFAVPVWWLAGFAVVAFVASLLAGLFPAVRAGRTVPAEALRLPG